MTYNYIKYTSEQYFFFIQLVNTCYFLKPQLSKQLSIIILSRNFFVCKHSKRNDQGIEVMTTRRLYLTCICFLCFPLHSRCSLIVAKKSKVFGRGVSSNNNVYLIALKVRNHLFTIETQLKSSNSYISSGRIAM